MALAAGTRLGPYEILGPLGAGGMGEVYRARDTRLDRTVAVKVLPADLAADPQLKARFEREARAISALAHPNICTLHDVGEQDGRTFLVMEHLVGQTLAERLEKGALPLEQALEIATQIADALSAAHRQGIVHRDLKPGNVMLTKTGARLLDFGLARLTAHGEQPAVESLTSAPTEAEPLTGAGTVMGTLPYMAPEQVEGKQADARTDLWALGLILYEMLTGVRAFEASTPTSLVGAILEREPVPLKERQPLTPPSLERLVRRCLAKDPDGRWDTAHDVADELGWIGETALAPTSREEPHARAKLIRNATVLLGAGALLGAASVWVLKPDASPPPLVHSLLDVRPAEELKAGEVSKWYNPTPGGAHRGLASTPDGRALVFVGQREGVQQLYVRRLAAKEARALEGTEGARVLTLSPDGEWVAFWADGAIRKVPLSGGPATVVAGDPDTPVGMSWGRDSQLFFGHSDQSIWRLSPEGVREPVTALLEAEVSHSLPHLLPRGDVLLFTVRKRVRTWGDEEVVAQILATGERKVLLRNAADARQVPSGHLVFLRQGVLFAVAFDPARLEVGGDPVPLLDGVAQALVALDSKSVTGVGQFDVAPNGVALAYLEGGVSSYPETRPVTIDRQGRVSVLSAPPRPYTPVVRISPDGSRLTLSVCGLTEWSLWLYEIARGTLTRLTSGVEAAWPSWSPDGERVVFTWLNDGVWQLAWQRTDGTEPPQLLAQDRISAPSWSPDGGQFAFVSWTGRGDKDISVATLEGSRATFQPLLQTPYDEMWPEVSPDGRWLAYVSNDSGRHEVYVQPFAGPGPRTRVSVGGGISPAWNPSGGELFFVTPPDPDQPETRHMMVAEVNTQPALRLGAPRPLFRISATESSFWCEPSRCYDVSADGQRFFAIQEGEVPPPPPVTHIHLIQNWLEEVKARVPTN